jgi:hypothetical protein
LAAGNLTERFPNSLLKKAALQIQGQIEPAARIIRKSNNLSQGRVKLRPGGLQFRPWKHLAKPLRQLLWIVSKQNRTNTFVR